MHAPLQLAFLTWPGPEGGTARVPREWVAASDWFVLFTLGTLLFLLGCFATWAWIIWRRTTRPEPHVRLLMELEQEDEKERQKDAEGGRPAASRDKPGTAAPWEQPADWWKKAGES